MRTRATVAGLTSSAAPMAASVQPGPASPWLAFNRMRAWVSALAGATPRPIMVCSRARSSSDRTTMCRLRTSASCGGGIPRPHEHETRPHITQITTDELLGPFGVRADDLEPVDWGAVPRTTGLVRLGIRGSPLPRPHGRTHSSRAAAPGAKPELGEVSALGIQGSGPHRRLARQAMHREWL